MKKHEQPINRLDKMSNFFGGSNFSKLMHCKLPLFALLRSFNPARDHANTFDTSGIGGFAKSQSSLKSLSHIRTFKIYTALRTYQLINENALICGGQSFTCRKNRRYIQIFPIFSTALLPVRRSIIAFPLLVDKL